MLNVTSQLNKSSSESLLRRILIAIEVYENLNSHDMIRLEIIKLRF